MTLLQYPITIAIIILTSLISIVAFKDGDLKYKLLLYPYRMRHNKETYRILSHIFIHADYMHLIFNMVVLFSFGSIMEHLFNVSFGSELGSFHFLILYLAGGVVATIWPCIRNSENPSYMSLGASGAVSAILFASIIWIPYGGIYVMFIPIEIPAWLFGILYLLFEFYMNKKGGGKIAHDAHIGGALFGVFYAIIIEPHKGTEFINYILG
ncbi:MAG: rhomboid family intramembrane serine protease [Brumimicrobium sp.]|nr:rhomboid family intramembrane serine protease [Brumimicrobium sp.]MCO5269177.1 rhomboid family intramembrane serine protease [Brumimicrobium sp.]